MVNPYSIIGGILIVLAAAVGGFSAGWKSHSGIVSERELAAVNERQAAYDASIKRESVIAEKVASEVAKINANTRIIEREKLKIVERPVYSNVCLDADGLRIIEQARLGSKANTGKPAAEVSASK